MTLVNLRKKGPLVEPFRWPLSPENDPPRALKSLARIIDGDLCHRCGSCVGICPTDVLGLDKEEYPIVKNISACTDCDLCVKVCPGDEFSVPSIAKQLFGHVPDINDMHGHFLSAYLTYATDKELRQNSTSGGLVTGLLIWLLGKGYIDGAVVIASHAKDLWKGVPIIARTKEELLSTTKSKYAISPTNVAFSEIRNVEGRYALVGLPCQIHGYHKAARLDKRLRDRVVLTVGLFCHAAVEHEPMDYIFKNVAERPDEAVRFVSRIGKHPGTPHLIYKDGTSKPVYFPEAKGYRPTSLEILNILYRLYTPKRCLTCYDSTSEFADIAVGDPWIAPPSDDIDFHDGYSFALARTTRGEELLRNAQSAGAIKMVKLRPDIARTSNRMMGEEKRGRAFRIIETLRRQGKPIPDYDIKIPSPSAKQFLLTELNMLSHILCYLPKWRLTVLKSAFSPLGYRLLWLNQQKRVFRNFRRDSMAKIKRVLSRKSSVIE